MIRRGGGSLLWRISLKQLFAVDRAYRNSVFPNPHLVSFNIFNTLQVKHVRLMDPHKFMSRKAAKEILDGIMYHQDLSPCTDPDIITLAFYDTDIRKWKGK